MSGTISLKEIKLVFGKSGNICAFRKCEKKLIEPGNSDDDASVVGDVAHIVGESRQGPRGDFPLEEEDRNKYPNLILVCKEHHKVIDDQPRTHSVAVLRQMKADHEAYVERQLTKKDTTSPPTLVTENIHSTIVPVTHLPEVVFSAPCGFSSGQEKEVKDRLIYPGDKNILFPFILREDRIFAFDDLRIQGNAFSDVIDRKKATKHRAIEMWRDPEGKRRYTNLLNRSLHKHTGRLGIFFDREHQRYYFKAEEFGKERTVSYRPMNKSHEERNVVWQPITKSTGLPKNFWWHLAAKLQFHQFADLQWCLSIRPERHLTRDSEQSLPSDLIGRKVTRLKARMYNDAYLSEVVFWRDFLSQGAPRFILDFNAQTAVIDVELLRYDVRWLGIPGDTKPFKNQIYQEDLFSLSGLGEAISGQQIDWDALEEELDVDIDEEADGESIF